MISHTIVLFDIDHTLIDTNRYRVACFEEVGRRLGIEDAEEFLTTVERIYKEEREIGYFRLQKFFQRILSHYHLQGDIESLSRVFFNEEIIGRTLYPETEGILKELSEKGIRIGIFSGGEEAMQQAKIQSLKHLMQDDSMYFNEVDKKQEIEKLVEKHKDDNVFIVDDLASVLAAVKKVDKDITTVWLKSDTVHRESHQEIGRPDYSISTLSELPSIIMSTK